MPKLQIILLNIQTLMVVFSFAIKKPIHWYQQYSLFPTKTKWKGFSNSIQQHPNYRKALNSTTASSNTATKNELLLHEFWGLSWQGALRAQCPWHAKAQLRFIHSSSKMNPSLSTEQTFQNLRSIIEIYIRRGVVTIL